MRRSALRWMLALALAPSAAAAQDAADRRDAQRLFDEARALMGAGRAAEACPKLEESQRLDPGPGTQLNLARCWELTHRTASAWAAYEKAIAPSLQGGHADWAERARAKVAELAPRVPRVVFLVVASGPGVEVRLDGAPVGSWGTPVPVDPGEHTVEASAPHKLTWRTKVAVPDAPGPIEVRVSPLADGEDPRPPDAPGAIDARRGVAIGLGVGGLAAIGIGAGFGVDAASKKNVLADPRACVVTTTETRCNGFGARTIDAARTSAALSTIFIAVGAAVAAGGVVLWLTAPKLAPTRAARVRVAPEAAGALVGLSVEGAF